MNRLDGCDRYYPRKKKKKTTAGFRWGWKRKRKERQKSQKVIQKLKKRRWFCPPPWTGYCSRPSPRDGRRQEFINLRAAHGFHGLCGYSRLVPKLLWPPGSGDFHYFPSLPPACGGWAHWHNSSRREKKGGKNYYELLIFTEVMPPIKQTFSYDKLKASASVCRWCYFLPSHRISRILDV